MPDYNPAVALGIQPDQGNNVAQTLNTINNLNIGQAHVGLYQLQLQQNQIEQNARQAGAQAVANNEDGSLAYYRAGGRDPAYGNGLQEYSSNRRGMQMNGGLLPGAFSQEQSGLSSAASRAKTLAEIPGTQAETDISQKKDAAAAAQGYFANPSDESWNTYIVGHAQKFSTDQMGVAALASIKDPDQRARIAGSQLAAGVPATDVTKVLQPGQSATPQQGAQPAQIGQPPQLMTPGDVKQQEAKADYFQKLYNGISALGNTSAGTKNDISLAKAAINDPNFWSGTGENYNLMYKRALALGGNMNALPQEVFKKVMAANILQQTNGMKAAAEEMGANSTRLFASQIDLMEKAAQNPENTIASNRFLTELADRTEQRNVQLADSAADYKNGKLDPTFEKQFRQQASAPLFGNWELKHLDTVGAPIADKLKQIDPREIQHLQANPKTAAQFDAYYGPGTAKAAMQ